jgi:hypothetical protein
MLVGEMVAGTVGRVTVKDLFAVDKIKVKAIKTINRVDNRFPFLKKFLSFYIQSFCNVIYNRYMYFLKFLTKFQK